MTTLPMPRETGTSDPPVPTESRTMRWLKRLGCRRLAWSLRRLYCPVDRSALVLEVGSGGNPYPRANVLLDAYESTTQRMEARLVADRPLVIAPAERMPFRDRVFDFVIASHVLEHSRDPGAFLNELMRVARAGYIETPEAFFERINPFTFHYLEVAENEGGLRIFKKPAWNHDRDVVALYENKLKKCPAFFRWGGRYPDAIHVRYYWRETIRFVIVNPEVDSSWVDPSPDKQAPAPGGWIREFYLRSRRWIFSQNRRNRNIDLAALLRCPSCRGEQWKKSPGAIQCLPCRACYPFANGVARMNGSPPP